MIAAFGPAALRGTLTYDQYVSLYLNRDRPLFRQAVGVAWGVYAALSNRDLPREWFAALAGDDNEAEEMEFQANAARQTARARTRNL